MNASQDQYTPEERARKEELNQARIHVKQARVASMRLKDFLAGEPIDIKPGCVRAIRTVTDLLGQVPEAAFAFSDLEWHEAIDQALTVARNFRDADEDEMDAHDIQHAAEELRRATARTIAGAHLSAGGSNYACPFGRWYDRLIHEMNGIGGQKGVSGSTISPQHEHQVSAEVQGRAFSALPPEAQQQLKADARAMKTWRRTGQMPVPKEVAANLRYKYESLR